MRSRNWSRTLTERSGGNGAVAVFMACYDCFFVQSMPRASKQQARYAVGRCLMLWRSNDVTQQGSRPKTKLGRTARQSRASRNPRATSMANTALCIHCGSFKKNHVAVCPGCRFLPTDDEDIAKSRM